MFHPSSNSVYSHIFLNQVFPLQKMWSRIVLKWYSPKVLGHTFCHILLQTCFNLRESIALFGINVYLLYDETKYALKFFLYKHKLYIISQQTNKLANGEDL